MWTHWPPSHEFVVHGFLSSQVLVQGTGTSTAVESADAWYRLTLPPSTFDEASAAVNYESAGKSDEQADKATKTKRTFFIMTNSGMARMAPQVVRNRNKRIGTYKNIY
ncbi:MAG: hypothetical protein HY979_03585 [Candidatus Magasanikbacteria bacterium]|nr:hypothetical protein [Candidatus Magasanikbacteria bacterium]